MQSFYHPHDEVLAVLREERARLKARLDELDDKESVLVASLAKMKIERFSTGKPMLDKLPIEIFRRICQLFNKTMCSTCDSATCSLNSNQGPVFQLCQTSKQLREQALPLLYESIRLLTGGTFPRTQADLLSRSLTENPELRKFVKRLSITSRGHRDFEILSLCDSLETLSVPDVELACRAKTLSLQSLTIAQGEYGESLCTLFEGPLRFRKFRFQQCTRTSDTYTVCLPAVRQAVASADFLEEFSIRVNLSLETCFLPIVAGIGTPPNLRKLKLEGGSEHLDQSLRTASDEEVSACRFKELWLPEAQLHANIDVSPWLGSVGAGLCRLPCLTKLHLSFDEDTGLTVEAPTSLMTLLPATIEEVIWSTKRYPSANAGSQRLLTDLVAAWAQHPNGAPLKRVWKIEAKLLLAKWAGLVAFRTACAGANVILEEKESASPYEAEKDLMVKEEITVSIGIR